MSCLQSILKKDIFLIWPSGYNKIAEAVWHTHDNNLFFTVLEAKKVKIKTWKTGCLVKALFNMDGAFQLCCYLVDGRQASQFLGVPWSVVNGVTINLLLTRIREYFKVRDRNLVRLGKQNSIFWTWQDLCSHGHVAALVTCKTSVQQLHNNCTTPA